MSLNLIKLAVGITDRAHLVERQALRVFQWDGRTVVPAYTRRKPRRWEELSSGGSLYWVIRGVVSVRQRIVGFGEAVFEEDGAYCVIQLDPDVVDVDQRPHRPFQGWRYLDGDSAPPDLRGMDEGDGEAMPADLAKFLREAGIG